MGEQNVQPLSTESRRQFLRHLLDDINSLETMIRDGMIEQGVTRIGAEQEYCLVADDLRPAMTGPEILAATPDSHFTSELARWNLEINLDPQDLTAGCIHRMETQLRGLLDLADQRAADFDSRVVLTGILPTIRQSDLDFCNMTPNPRYRALNAVLRQMRGEDFSLHLEGVDEINLRHDSILFEACNTSFQIHLQIDPDEFADRYNWAQIIAGPVLACCVNSPLLLGKELWSETRIALFRQSLDIRHPGSFVSDRQPRVAFGFDWIKASAAEIFRNDVTIYPLIIAAEMEGRSSQEVLRDGGIPKLTAMNLHNGTLYKWNRACYGIGGGKPHLRIENRYIPAGPTPHDEMANTVFWVGLMLAMPQRHRGQWDQQFWFQDVRSNFLKAARTGLSSKMVWFGEYCDASRLVLEQLLPMAADALGRAGIPSEEFAPFLETVSRRVARRRTGADWIVESLRRLRRKHTLEECQLLITHSMVELRREGGPGHEWPTPQSAVLKAIPGRYQRAESIMSTWLVTVRQDDLLEFAGTLMDWNGFHHLPVENDQGNITGIVSARDISEYRQANPANRDALVRDCMSSEIVTIAPETSLDQAESMMHENGFGSLPVVREGRAIGIITAEDIRNYRKKLNQA